MANRHFQVDTGLGVAYIEAPQYSNLITETGVESLAREVLILYGDRAVLWMDARGIYADVWYGGLFKGRLRLIPGPWENVWERTEYLEDLHEWQGS